MNMTDQEQLKSRVIQAVEEMDPRYVSIIFQFILGLAKGPRKETDETILRSKITGLLSLIHSPALLKRIYGFFKHELHLMQIINNYY